MEAEIKRNTDRENVNTENIDKEKVDKEKIDLDLSIPSTDSEKESDKRRIELMDEKVEEGTPERPSQEDGGKAE